MKPNKLATMGIYIIVLLLARTSSGDTIYVNRLARCPGDGSEAAPFCALGAALTVAKSGDTIILKCGFFSEVPIIDKRLTITASGGRALIGSADSPLTTGLPLLPKSIETHPRLAPIPGIHFDHYNSDVTDYPGPLPGRVEVNLLRYANFLGLCLNFLLDSEGNIYGFCGRLEGAGVNVSFRLTLFDGNLGKIDEYEIGTFRTRALRKGDLPLNLGYFVMDNQGRVIVVKNAAEIVFVKKNAANKLEAVITWDLGDQIKETLQSDLGKSFRDELAEQTIAQVFPAYDRGHWIMALGKVKDDGVVVHSFIGKISDSGKLEDIHVFQGEVIENGMTMDGTGAYVATDYALYKFIQRPDGKVEVVWHSPYARATKVKPGSLSEYGSGSTPTLVGNDLIAFTDNADNRVNLLVLNRHTGQSVCKVPLFKPGKSANENSVLAYDQSIIVQNWYNAPPFDEDMWGLEPGLARIDVRKDRSGCGCVWENEEFASTATVRLSTRTGVIYATVQTAEDDNYAMALIDFHSGRIVQRVPLGNGNGYRIAMSPAYFVPEGRLVQPVRRGVVVLKKP